MSRNVRCTAIAVAGLVLAVAGCESERVVDSGTEVTLLDVPPTPSVYDSCERQVPIGPACGQVLRLSFGSGTSVLTNAANGAAALWSSVLEQHPGLPTFGSTGDRTISIVWGFSFGNVSTDPWYCGTVNAALTQVTVHRSQYRPDCGRDPNNAAVQPFSHATQADGLDGLFAHEFSHLLTISDHALDHPSTTAPAAHCANSLPADLGFNEDLCQWEIQKVLFNYGMRPFDPNKGAHFVTGLGMQPAAISVAPQASKPVTVEILEMDLANPLVFPAQPDGPPGAAPTNQTFQWTALSPSIATVTASSGPSATVNGVAAGTGSVKIAVTNPGTFELAYPFATDGATLPVTVELTAPDLTPSDVTGQATAYTGTPYVLGFKVRNAGTAPASGAWTGRVYLSQDAQLGSGDIAVDSFPGVSLATGAVTTLSRTITLAGTVGAGARHWLVRVDAGNTVVETNETNNVATKSVTVADCRWGNKAYVTVHQTADYSGVGNCAGRTATITDGTGIAGFAAGSGCLMQESVSSPTGTFTFRGCKVGIATLRVYRDAAKTQLEATVEIRITLVDI